MILYAIHFKPKLTETEVFFKEEELNAIPIYDFHPIEIEAENGSMLRYKELLIY